MKKITKDKIDEFAKYYHDFHDSYITNINYDINNSKVELLIDACWSGVPILKEDNTYETNKTKMKINFNDVKIFNCKEIFSWEYIHKSLIQYIKNEDQELICFANSKEDPTLYIVCNSIEYEEIK